jgi:hypothetical protein
MRMRLAHFLPGPSRLGLGALALPVLLVLSLMAQTPGKPAALSGTIHASSGATVAAAKVTARNTASGQVFESQADSAGIYKFGELPPGDYEISASAEGFSSEQAKVTIAAGAGQTTDFTLSSALSLQDLGFGKAQTQGNAQEQARLDKRSHMLKVHQKLGLITTIPLVATVLTGGLAGGRSTSSSTRDLHAALGSATAGLYAATAYYAIFAPKIPGTKAEGPIRFHKALAWVHGPGMVLTPILGAMAFNQKSQGERVHGIASAHGEVAIITAAAYGLAILSVTKPHLLSRTGHDFLAAFGLGHSDSEDTYRDTSAGTP